MKSKYLLFLFSLVFCFNISAQEFAPFGAEWHYTVINKQDITYHQAKSVDSIDISGKKCRIIDIDESCFFDNEGIVYSTADGDSVFWYEPHSETFQLIYAFNASPGDSWKIAIEDFESLSETDSIVVFVESVGSQEINGITLPTLHLQISYKQYSSYFRNQKDTITKHIGGTRALIPYLKQGHGVICHLPSPNGLRCYEDSYLGFYETGIADSCTHEKTGTFVNELKNEETGIKLFPNPVTQTLNISLQNGTLRSLVFYDLSGREVFSKTVSDKNQFEHQINLSGLPAGAYMVKIDTQNKSVVKKLIKQ